MTRLLLLLVLVISTPPWAADASSSQDDASSLAAFAQVRDPGVVALLRHATAPGVGDPLAFELGRCDSQRLLSDAGRAQARALGVMLRRTGVSKAAIFSSQWCRCLETARLLDLGRVVSVPYLNSFFAGRADEATATTGLRRAILGKTALLTPTIMVTHQVNITALTGVVPAEGEMVFVRGTAAGGVAVVGRARLSR